MRAQRSAGRAVSPRGVRPAALIAGVLAACALVPWTRARASGEGARPEPPVPGWISFEGEPPMAPQILFTLLGLPMGQVPSAEEMSAATDRLVRLGIVRKADARLEGEPGVEPRWILCTERSPYVRDLDIQGNFPLLESEVREAIPIRQGRAYDPDRLPEVKDAISTLLRREGFLGPTVLIREAPIEPGWVDIDIEIDKGRPIRLVDLEIAGDPDIPGFWRKLYWPLYVRHVLTQYLRFNEADTLDAAEDLTASYRKRGYPECEVRIQARVDEEEAEAYVEATIRKGPRLVLAFLGNRAVSDSTLRGEVTFFREGAMDEFEVEATTQALLALYRKEGYPEARIEADLTRRRGPEGEDQMRIAFRIREGPRLFVSSIRVEGERAIGEDRIRDQILLRPAIPLVRTAPLDERAIEEDGRAIETLYRIEGFEGARVLAEVDEPRDGEDVSARVTYHVAEGKRTLVRAIRFRYDFETLPPEELAGALALKPGSPYSSEALGEDRKAIVRAFSEAGYPYVSLAPAGPERIEEGPQTAWVVLDHEISTGPLVRFASPVVRGNFYTRPDRILSEVVASPGEPLAMSRILESKTNLRELGVFSSVSIRTPGLGTKAEWVAPLVEVGEAPRWLVEAEVGYNSREAAKGSATIADRNLFGRAVSTSLTAGYGQRGHAEALAIADPRLLGLRLRGDASLSYSYDATSPLYNATTLEGAGAITREIWPRTTGSLGLSVEDGRLTKIRVSSNELRVPEENLTVLAEASVRLDRRDDIIDPRAGWWLGLFGGSAGGPLGGDSHFFRYRVEGKHFSTWSDLLTVAASLRVGHIVPYGARAEVPLQQRFLLGGLFTVRGFAEDSLGPVDDEGHARGGFVQAIGNLELRFPIWGGLRGQVFLDAGSLTDTWSGLGIESVRPAAGCGVRYQTPVGPIRLDYAANLDRRSGEEFGRVYFSFGNPF